MGNDEEARIVQLYRDHNRYMVAGDTKKLGVLLDANFHLVEWSRVNKNGYKTLIQNK